MWDRCTRPTHRYFDRYGGRGIQVCERWKSFDAFLTDMGPRPPGTSLDRIDNNGNYEPSNCRWTDSVTQLRNKPNVRKFIFEGEQLTVPQIAERVGIPTGVLGARLKTGWSLERAISVPVLTGVLKNSTRLGENCSSSKLTELQVKDIRKSFQAGTPMPQLAADYGVRKQTIRQIVTRMTWRHI